MQSICEAQFTPQQLAGNSLEQLLKGVDKPVVIRGLVAHWPCVELVKQNAIAELQRSLLAYYQQRPVTTFYGDAKINGRFFYDDELQGLNFTRQSADLNDVFSRLNAFAAQHNPPSLYMGSTNLDTCFKGFCDDNKLRVTDKDVLSTIWLGNASRVAAHYDLPHNIACVVAGTRKFTLFAPEQIDNLYIGPIDFTPAGQAISLVDFHQPDYDKFPRFELAQAAGLEATLKPGDGIYIPPMWWHHVEALDTFNVLVNYWWRTSPAYMGSPVDLLHHAVLSLRDLPDAEKRAWRHILDHYIFNHDEQTLAHIPKHSRASLGELNTMSARKLRAMLLNKLNR